MKKQRIIGAVRYCDGSKIKRGEQWQSCVDVCDENDCPQKLIIKKRSKRIWMQIHPHLKKQYSLIF